MTKICGKCKEDKPLDKFVKKRDGRFGVSWSCKKCRHEDGSKYYFDNKSRINSYKQLPEEKSRQRKWRQANQHVKNFHAASWRAQRKLATPKWLNKDQVQQMKNLYKEARSLSKITNIQHHVDHILPLNNEMLSGLHVPWNLQILIYRDNIQKSNKVDEEAIADQCNVD